MIDIPLSAVLSGLSHELKSRVRQTDVGDATVSISLDRVLSQLAHGSVKLAFGELRQAAPELFTSATDHDQVEVALPLNEILRQVNPTLIVRRQNQKQIVVPQEISSPFGDRGNGLVFSMGPKAPEATPPPRAITPAIPAEPSPKEHKPVQAAPQPKPVQQAAPFQSPPFRPAPIQAAPAPPPQARPAPAPSAHVPPPPSVPETAAPSAIPVSSALRNLGSSIGLTAQDNQRAHPVRPHRPAQTPAMPAPEKPSLLVPLRALADGWPEALRIEVAQLNLGDSKIALPIDTLEEAMKRGKVTFPWKTLRSWIKPTPPPTVSVHDTAVLELPLRIVAPLFLSRNKDAVKTQHKVAVNENIPNLFFGFPQSEPTPAAPAPPSNSGTTSSLPRHAVPKPVDIKPVETNYYVWDDTSESAKVDETEFKRNPAPSYQTNFLSRHATPNEVVARAAELDGVTGALVALPDGLMVASKLPPELNGDTLAAFLPQIFGRVSQCTKELRMGDLNNLNFTVGNIPWKIFRVNAIFFAAFGQAGQGLPTAQLATLAAELDRKKQ